MYKLKLSILLNLFILTFAISEEGCKGKCEGNVLKFESTKKFNTIGEKYNTTPPGGNTEKKNLKARINKKELEFNAKLDNKPAFKEGKFSKHKYLNHKPFYLSQRAKNHVNNLEKELLLATEQLKALFKPIRIHTKKPTRNYIKLQKKKRSLKPNEQIIDLADNLRYGTSFDRSFDNKFGHKFDLSPTGMLNTQGFVNNSRSGNDNDYFTRKGHQLSSSPEELSKLEEWNVRKGRGLGYESSGSQGYANQYFLNPAAAQSPVNNIPPYLLPYRTVSDVGANPLLNQPNNFAQPYDRVVTVSDPRLFNLQGHAPQFGYNVLPSNVPINLPIQSALVQPSYYPHIPSFY